MAKYGNNLHYINWFYSPAKPYTIKKFGYGYQRYLFKDTYLSNAGLFTGYELNLMNVRAETLHNTFIIQQVFYCFI